MANPADETVRYPFSAFNFQVEINVPGVTQRACNAAFAECDGLEMTMEVKTIREGGNVPDLGFSECPVIGATVNLAVTNGLPHAGGCLGFGANPDSVPAFGGALLVEFGVLVPHQLDSAGACFNVQLRR